MTPDQEARILMAFDHAVGQMKEHVRAEVTASELRIKETVANMKVEIVRVDSRVTALERDSDGLKSDVLDLKKSERVSVQDELEEATTEIRRRDEDRRKWAFWAITAVVGVVLSGGGILAVLGKLVFRR